MRRLAVLIAVQLYVASLPAAVLPPGKFSFRTYGAESGLGNLSVMRIAQDSSGFLWVATQDGIHRFDGRRFVRFGLEAGLPSSFVSSIAVGRRGEVWAGTSSGVARWNGSRFVVESSLPAESPNALAVDRTGRAWAAFPQGLFVRGAARFTPVAGWSGEATALFADPVSGEIWAARRGSIQKLSRGHWTTAPFASERIDGIVVDSERRLWVRSANHLYSRGENEAVFRDESAALPATSNSGYLCLDAHGHLWVPTDRGIAIHDAEGWRVIGAAQGLPTEWARDITEDREGSIWIGSLGVHRMLGRGELMSYTRSNGLPNDVTWVFHVARDGHLLVGTDLGLARSTRDGWMVVRGTEGMQIRTLVEEADGALWLAGSPATIVRLGSDGSVQRFGEAEGVTGRRISSMQRDGEGNLWAATIGGGVLRKARDEPRFRRVEIPGSSPGEEFRQVLIDSKGRLWVTGARGLACWANGKWSRFGAKDGLRADHVSYLLETRGGEMWVAYYEPLGISRFRVFDQGGPLRIRVVEHVDSTTTLTSNKVFLLGEDDRGRIWVGSGIGVDVLGTGGLEHYGSHDGLAGDDVDAMAFLCDDEGTVYIGTSSGFSRYVSRADPRPVEPPPVQITATELLGGASGKRRDFAAEFAALSFYKPDAVEYQVRMVGLDDAWQRADEGRARFSRLPPARYRFEVRARVERGAWSAPATYAFTVEPLWWERWAARVAALLLLAALLWGGYRGRVAMLSRRNRELEAIIADRTRDLEALTVTDALTGLKNRRYVQLCMAEYTGDSLRRYEVLTRAGLDATRGNADLVFLMIDLDFFKEVNDRYGHLGGDAVLVEFGRLVARLMRETDTLVRWGGEEFLFIARNTSRGDAPMIAERIRAAVEAHEFSIGAGQTTRVSCSIGFTAFPFLPEERHLVTWHEVIDLADVCLYQAKRTGRNRWVGIGVGDSVEPETLVARIRASFDEAVQSGEIEVYGSGDSTATTERRMPARP